MSSPWPPPAAHGMFVSDMVAGAWALRRAIPDRTESGPDHLMLTYEGRFDSALIGAAPSIEAFPRGAAPSGYSGAGAWGVTTARPMQLYGPFWRLEVSCKGRIAMQVPKVRWTTGGREFQAEDVAFPGSGGPVDRVRSRQPEVGVEISYLTIGTKPSVSVGVAAIPAEPRPANPANIWSSISADNAVFYHPSGWVREGFEADELVPGFWWCAERFVYVFEITG